MLKKRIIPVQLLLQGRLVKTQGFGKYREVGDPVSSSRVYNSQLADELVFLNIERDPAKRTVGELGKIIQKVAEVCFMPLAVGGGIRSIEDAGELIRNGADKVIVNSAAYRNPALLSEISDRFGAQALVVSIDVRRESTGLLLYSECAVRREPVTLTEHIRNVMKAGAGEILVNSIDRDGMMTGYDLDAITEAVKATTAPVIGCGGAGTFQHLLEGFQQTGAGALACGSLFNFGDNNPIRAKAFLSNYGIPFKVV